MEGEALILCPTCQNEVEVLSRLREDSADELDYDVNMQGHERCNQVRLTAAVRRFLKKPREKIVRQPKSQASRNRRNGRDAQRRVARLTGARDIGTLGGVDLDLGWAWGEVKQAHAVPAWFAKGFDQLAVKSDRPVFLFLELAPKVGGRGHKYAYFVIQDLDQWIAWSGGAK